MSPTGSRAATAVVWFRRDLRVHDHPALVRAVEEFGQVASLFVVHDRLVGSGMRPAPNRAWFMRESVAALAASLAERGAKLTVLRGDPAALVPGFATAVGARAILVSRDRSPYGRNRDAAVERASASRGITFMAEPGLLVQEPETVTRMDGGGFTVFSPFRRAWEAVDRRPVLAAIRMLVAGFLTKHLGIDWRVGAAHFMAHLVGGDVASNAGGWQWAASTGADAQPWFRVFNPTLQARRHDPDGDYVRRWVPELAARTDLSEAEVHEPPPGTYLAPIVSHGEARQRALAAYRQAAARRSESGEIIDA